MGNGAIRNAIIVLQRVIVGPGWGVGFYWARAPLKNLVFAFRHYGWPIFADATRNNLIPLVEFFYA